MSSGLRDPLKSAAVIAGVFEQTPESDLPNLPAVENNISALTQILRDPKIWGLPADRCIELPQPTRESFLTAVGSAGAAATDTLFVYFAGHGIVHPATDRLHLALPNFRDDGEYGTRTIRYGDLQDLLWEPRIKARHKVIVLDTCFSATAFDDSMGVNAVYGSLRTRGACTLVSSDVTEISRAPQGTDYTSYTACLLSTLRYGIEGEGAALTLQAIHQHVSERLRLANISTPRILSVDDTALVRIAHNRAHDSSADPGGRSNALLMDQWQDFQNELFNTLKGGLGVGHSTVRVGNSLPWPSELGPQQEGERLLAFIEHRTVLVDRFTAFTTQAVKFRHGNNGVSVKQVKYEEMSRWSVKAVEARPVWEWLKDGYADWYGIPERARFRAKCDILLTCDGVTFC
ncbi:caspase family protein, partial [Streptomyces sp. NPDC052535]